MTKFLFKKIVLKAVITFTLIAVSTLTIPPITRAADGSGMIANPANPPVQRSAPAVTVGTTNLLDQAPNQSNGWYSDSIGPYSVADNFVITSPAIVDEIILWGGYHPDNVPLAVDSFTVIIHEDTAGLPGTAVYSHAGIAAAERTDTGINLFGVDEYRFTLALPAPVTLSPGIYWVEIFNNTSLSSSNSNFFWETGNPDPTHGLNSGAHANETPGSNWNDIIDPNFAIQINSTQSDTIPTLNEWGMIIFSILLTGGSLLTIRKRQTRII